MKKVADLEAQGKYREAFSKLPPPNEFPNYADKIRKKGQNYPHTLPLPCLKNKY